MRIPLGQYVYKRGEAKQPLLELVNRFYEQDPTNTVDGCALLARPVTKKFLTAPEGPVRKLIHQQDAFDNDLFLVAGPSLYRYKPSTQTFTKLGDGFRGYPPVSSFADISVDAEIITGPEFQHLFISDGTLLHLYVEGAQSTVPVPLPTPYAAGSIAQLGKYLLVSCSKNDRFYYIPPGEVDIKPLHFYTAEKQSDEISAIRVIGDKIVVLGRSTVEFWHLSPQISSDEDVFVPYVANALNIGTIPGSALVVKNMLVFTGTDHMVYVLSDTAQVISTYPISESIRLAEEKKRRIISDLSLI